MQAISRWRAKSLTHDVGKDEEMTRPTPRMFILLIAFFVISGLLVGLPLYDHLKKGDKLEAERIYCASVLRNVDLAKEQFSIENGVSNGALITMGDIEIYMGNWFKECPAGGELTIGRRAIREIRGLNCRL